MFTGIIEEIGLVKSIKHGYRSRVVVIECQTVLENTVLGDSIAINGVCQTVTSLNKSSFIVDVLEQTLLKTNLNLLKKGDSVNLERAITLNRPFGGHFVQGHIQGVGTISSIKKQKDNMYLRIKLPKDIRDNIIKEGSITVDGLSLTVADIIKDEIVINIIPHTKTESTVGSFRVGRVVNIEPDMLVKSVIKNEVQGLTKEKLISWGF
ncbi:riboflavin synthase [Thiospirochaeta perfilievii]|uniref:Riboflavin synthase n=1 Tax=Thiospirochaeta perfilievii TaxID=252967 RepID=A0A5C1QD31_9SPIO|nr:riboflavin synthase [Thiospirochaeta perfilievii]QEN04546.1 riboflavin synthase [Thiospirochaeta perfilievii]